jgi:CRP-like cAMP-binding protein
MNDIEMRATDPNAVLARLSGEKSELKYQKHHILYSQGNPADSVFYVRSGKAKMAVVSPEGKEAVIGILQP